MAEIVMDKTPTASVASYDKDKMNETVDYFMEHSRVKSNGIREVPKPAFMEEVKKHGVTQADFERVQTVTDFMTTAAHELATRDLEDKISNASAEDLKDDSFRRGLSATVRLPTHGGSTQVTMKAEAKNPIPFRGEAGGDPQFKISYAQSSTTINAKGRVARDFQDEARSRIRSALGMEDTVD